MKPTKETKNTFIKFCPNVFVAKCEAQHEKGDLIILTTKYGKEVENEVFNFLGKSKDGHFLYSIVRTDGINSQERATNKADKLNGYAANAEKRSDEAYQASREGADFLALGEPIKVGHHSESRHRNLIKKNWDRMDKSVKESKKADEYKNRAKYWERKAKDINLSMPESLGFYEFKLEEAKTKHKFYKDNPEAREHSYSLTYANKAVKDTEKKLNLAVRLWGSPEEVQQIANEKQEQAQKKASKSKKADDLIKEYGGFFAFGNEQFKEGYAKILKAGIIEEGEKVMHIVAGLYVPSKLKDEFIKEYFKK